VEPGTGPRAQARIEFGDGVHTGDPDHFRAETLLIVAHRFSGWLIRRRIPLHRVELGYPAPPHALEYDLLFGAPCVFGADATALVFDRALLNEPVLQDEAGIAAFLRRAPQDVLARIDYGSTTAARVRRLLGQSLPGLGSPSPGSAATSGPGAQALPAEAEIAGRLALSPQTLRRRLAAEGTSFQQIRDQMRRDHAIAALAQGRTPIEQISQQLGFSEPSAFHRAFKRWTGSTPRAYRPGAHPGDPVGRTDPEPAGPPRPPQPPGRPGSTPASAPVMGEAAARA
jgi:AraC-like DNA-binding protein